MLHAHVFVALIFKLSYLPFLLNYFFLDFRLDMSLQKACKRDIKKFCSNFLVGDWENEELEGKVVNCLKKHFHTKQKVY